MCHRTVQVAGQRSVERAARARETMRQVLAAATPHLSKPDADRLRARVEREGRATDEALVQAERLLE